ncbi:MAG: PIG-L family deacetylase, partial [Myxococcales bacterium]|nr:PIG-L family deacetylase [Myxococcales bacterium]
MFPLALASLLVAGGASAQSTQPSSGELLRAIENLRSVGSVLYVAAHPDDENTRLIAWLVGQRGLRVGYLSLTRGGGGQNLIGDEQAELLGVVRTGELLAARQIDGAEQFFSRARDFGYSKSADEALRIWNREAVLSDVVRAIREFRPDVIITRFDDQPPNHGHHTASALLAAEAFTEAAESGRFFGVLPAWQADRLLYNQSHWRITPQTDTSKWLRLDVGTYDPRIGRSYGEVAAASRSMHKSQGFGAAPDAGAAVEYFTPLAGHDFGDNLDPLSGLKLGWERFAGTEKLDAALAAAVVAFDPHAPQKALPRLAEAHALMAKVPDEGWRALKTAALDQVMADCVGLWLTARAEAPAVAPGRTIGVEVVAQTRLPAAVELVGVTINGQPVPGMAGKLAEPTQVSGKLAVAVPADAPLSQPHWLRAPPLPALYDIADRSVAAAAAPALNARFDLRIAGQPVTLTRPVEYAWTDAVAGERRHPVEVLPAVTATFDRAAVMLPKGEPAHVRVALQASVAQAGSGTLRFAAPPGYRVEPAQINFALTEAGAEQAAEVIVSAEPGAKPGTIAFTIDGQPAWQRAVLDHAHLPRQTVLRPAKLDLVPLELARGPSHIAYVPGSGDHVAEALRQVGYQVEEIGEEAIAAGDLSRFDALLMGIRAYNTHPRLVALHAPLMAYVAAGGRLIVQYNTNNRFNPLDGPLGPAPFAIGRDRITDETAELRAVDPK